MLFLKITKPLIRSNFFYFSLIIFSLSSKLYFTTFKKLVDHLSNFILYSNYVPKKIGQIKNFASLEQCYLNEDICKWNILKSIEQVVYWEDTKNTILSRIKDIYTVKQLTKQETKIKTADYSDHKPTFLNINFNYKFNQTSFSIFKLKRQLLPNNDRLKN